MTILDSPMYLILSIFCLANQLGIGNSSEDKAEKLRKEQLFRILKERGDYHEQFWNDIMEDHIDPSTPEIARGKIAEYNSQEQDSNAGTLGKLLPRSLIQVQESKSSSFCCRDKTLTSCQKVVVDITLLDSQQDILLHGISLSFVSTIPPNGLVYRNNKGDEAVLSYNKNTRNIFGTFRPVSGGAYILQKCGSGYTWSQYNIDELKPDIVVQDNYTSESNRVAHGVEQEAIKDTETMATISIMFYYTPKFACNVENIDGFVDNILELANLGYANSKVPITLVKHCIEEATINEEYNSDKFIDKFANMKKSYAALRNTADAAVLLCENFRAAGVAYIHQAISQGKTISIVQRKYAINLFTLGHEIGHNMGLDHNMADSRHTQYPYGHGHLIKGGFRTKMAYNRNNHTQIVNYYSNPELTYSNGAPLGVVGISNNAAVLIKNRFIMQEVGDESGSCHYVTSTCLPPTTASTTTETTEITTSGVLQSPNFPGTYNRNYRLKKTIKVANGYRIKISFTAFDIAETCYGSMGCWGCRNDYISMKDGNGKHLLRRSCGTDKPANFMSETNAVIVRFETHGRKLGTGFSLNWKAIPVL